MIDYEKELEFAVQLLTALEYVVSVIEEHPMEYPLLMADMICLVHGRRVSTSDDSHTMVNGLEEQILELCETIDALDLEVLYTKGGADDAEARELQDL